MRTIFVQNAAHHKLFFIALARKETYYNYQGQKISHGQNYKKQLLFGSNRKYKALANKRKSPNNGAQSLDLGKKSKSYF
jgi:hypothetical protein